MKVYLDNAATTALAPEVLEAMMPYLTQEFGNPSSQHSHGRTTRAAIEQARKKIATLLQAQTSEIIFTSGGTESSNIALLGAVRNLKVERIIVNPLEHHCVLHTVEYLEKNDSIELVFVKILSNGEIDYQDLAQLLQNSQKKTLVSIMHGNNEIGVLSDMQFIGDLCKQYNAYYHSDTVQTIAHYTYDLSQLNVHFITGSAHKFHGPKGIGFLYIKKGIQVDPLIIGGGQERNKRAGTENLYGIVGMAAAMEIAYQHLDEEKKYVQSLKEYLYKGLKSIFEDIEVNGVLDENKSLFTVLNMSFPPNAKGPLLLFNLDMEGISVSGGSACSSGASSGSHVINALNKDNERVSIRFSFSKYNTKEELDYTLDKIQKVFSN
jgi:cysteine desulfurase